jgi:hypothetical protein
MAEGLDLEATLQQIHDLKAQGGAQEARKPETLGDRVGASLRESQVLTLRDVSYFAGVSRSTLSRIESGKTMPRPSTIHSLAYFYGVAPRYLTTGEDAYDPYDGMYFD